MWWVGWLAHNIFVSAPGILKRSHDLMSMPKVMFKVYICLFKVYRGVRGVNGSFTFALTVFKVEIASTWFR